MNKIQKYHYSISEFGNLQARIITEYQDDEGNVLDKKYSDPYTPVPVPTKDVESEVDGVTVITKVPLTQVELDKEGIEVEDIGGFNMAGWDQKSKDIVTSITDSATKTAFILERLANGRDALEQYKTGLAELVDYDRVIDDEGRIAVRRITRIFDEGKEVSKKYHRSWVMPTDDSTNADVISKAVAEKLHTPDVIAAYETKMAESVELEK